MKNKNPLLLKDSQIAFISRISLFVVYFYFGALKLFDLSPATPLARSLSDKFLGPDLFEFSFFLLAFVEVLIGLAFLFKKTTKLAVYSIVAHTIMVSSPMVLLVSQTWSSFAVPTLEGQYIIKNLVLVALSLNLLKLTNKK